MIKKNLLSCFLLLYVIGCSENDLIVSPVSYSPEKLAKYESTMFIKDASSNALNKYVNYYGQNYFDILNVKTESSTWSYWNTTEIGLGIYKNSSNIPIHENGEKAIENTAYFRMIRDKYFEITGTLCMNDLPERTASNSGKYTLRASFWVWAPIYSGEVFDDRVVNAIDRKNTSLLPDLPHDGLGLGFEIYTSHNDLGKITMTAGVNDYGASQDETANLEFFHFTKTEFNQMINNRQFKIDVNPRYIELTFGTLPPKRIPHSFSTPSYWIPAFSYYYLQDDKTTLPPIDYLYKVTGVNYSSYRNFDQCLNYPVKLGVVNYSAKRFSFDTKRKNLSSTYPTYTAGILDGLSDKAYVYKDLKDEDIPLSGKNCFGFYRPSTRTFYLDADDNGTFERVFSKGNSGDIPVLGNWFNKTYNSKTRATIGLFRPSTGQHFLYDGYPGTLKNTVVFGQNGDIPISGYWDWSGHEHVGVYRPQDARFWSTLSESGAGVAYSSVAFGDPTTGLAGQPYSYILKHLNDFPITGDWDNNGLTNVGVYRVAERQFWFHTTSSVSRLDFDEEGLIPMVLKK